MKNSGSGPNMWTQIQNSRRADSADLWIKRKGIVIIVLALSIYAFYVAVGRTFVPAVQQRTSSAYGRAAGIGLLAAFVVLWLMFMWSYVTIITRPPGFARDLVPEAPKPWTEAEGKLSAATVPTAHSMPEQYHAALPISSPPHPSSGPQLQDTARSESVAPTPASHSHPGTYGSPARFSDAPVAPNQSRTARHVPRPNPIVTGEPRWCQHCKIIKPDRTHHCRHCGTCILQFDHHCMWIGQCVGWNNHSVFLTFNLWAGLFCVYTAVVLLVDVASSSQVDGQKIAIIAVSGILAIFTAFMMLPTHLFLILKGRSTVESFQSSAQLRAENSALENAFQSKCMTSDMRRVRRHWEAEYGGVEVNDRWAFGRKRDLWKQEMGSNWIGWILPIGRPQGDGMHFPSNPRFGPNGEWLPMKDWPKVVAI